MIHLFCNLEEDNGAYAPMCNMTFEIAEARYDANASCWHLDFQADADPFDPVGFGAIIPVSGWHEQVDGLDDTAFHSFWGTVSLHSHGAASDRLLEILADFYGVSMIADDPEDDTSDKWTFADSIICPAVGIQSNPALMGNEAINLKLFFTDETEDGPYAELFLAVDLPKRLGWLDEKDQDYRSDLVHWLAGLAMANTSPSAH